MEQFINAERRTNVDEVFDKLYDDIVTLKLMPGTKISEAEIASQFSVSRQPVRDAFARLGNRGLLLIRPQKATVVRKFSATGIAHARFIRTAIEVEVLRNAIVRWPETDTAIIRDIMDEQEKAIPTKDTNRFHELDLQFHNALCIAAGFETAFDIISEMKTRVDRLGRLSLEEPTEMNVLLQDHRDIISALDVNDPAALDHAIRTHLGRLDSFIGRIQQEQPEYFE